MRKLISSYAIAIVLLLATHREDPPEETPPTTTIVFPRAVQILMPGNLCDNLQSTLQYWVKEVLATTYPYRQQWADKVSQVWTDMQAAGCV